MQKLDVVGNRGVGNGRKWRGWMWLKMQKLDMVENAEVRCGRK